MNLIRFEVIVCAALMLCACGQKADQARTCVERGVRLVEAEQYDEAIRLFNKAIEIDPQHPDSYLQLALLYDDCMDDTTNAISAYERFLQVATDTTAKERAERWLVAARERKAAPPEDREPFSPSSPNLQEELKRKERQFDILRQQTAARFEAELDALKAQLEVMRTTTVVLKRENTALRSISGAGAHTGLLASLSSNEQVIAWLTAALDTKQKEAATAMRARDALQLQTTQLQNQLDQANRSTVALTNTPAVVGGEDMKRQLLALERERNDLQSKCLRMQELLARTTSAVAVVASAGSIPAVPAHALSPAEGGTRPATPKPITDTTTPTAGTRAPRTAAGAAPPPARTYSDKPVAVAPVTYGIPVGTTPGASRIYIVQSGDSLMKIARTVYGDQNKWTVLYDGNRDTLDRPNQLKVGHTIRVPALPR